MSHGREKAWSSTRRRVVDQYTDYGSPEGAQPHRVHPEVGHIATARVAEALRGRGEWLGRDCDRETGCLQHDGSRADLVWVPEQDKVRDRYLKESESIPLGFNLWEIDRV